MEPVNTSELRGVGGRCGGAAVPNDVYLQPDAPDPVLPEDVVLTPVQPHVPDAASVTAVDESDGEAPQREGA
jgi:hypothetical protein